MAKRSRLTPKFDIKSTLMPSEIEVGGQAVHTIDVVNESKRPCRYYVVLTSLQPDKVDYVAKQPDGTVVHSVEFGLSLDVGDTFHSRLSHVKATNSCANLPHRVNVDIYWGDKTGLPKRYENPEMRPGLAFQCIRTRTDV